MPETMDRLVEQARDPVVPLPAQFTASIGRTVPWGQLAGLIWGLALVAAFAVIEFEPPGDFLPVFLLPAILLSIAACTFGLIVRPSAWICIAIGATVLPIPVTVICINVLGW